MNMIRRVAATLMLASALPVAAQLVRVGLEPMPPLILNAEHGYTIALLRACEAVSGLRFRIVIMPYSRGRIDLKGGAIDLLGHTPYQVENEEFYRHAQELSWTFPVKTDFYAVSQEHLRPGPGAKVGVPRGNRAFAAMVTGLPEGQFYDRADLNGLLQMLSSGRLDAVYWERASTMGSIRKLGLENILYREIAAAPAGLAVRKDAAGSRLRAELEAALQKVDARQIYAGYSSFMTMPVSGTVPVH
jgi:polar amino acid transport system substrate-binding protein